MIEHAAAGLLAALGAVLILSAIGFAGFLGSRLLDGVARLAELALDKWRKPPPT